jgi:dolichol kinase
MLLKKLKMNMMRKLKNNKLKILLVILLICAIIIAWFVFQNVILVAGITAMSTLLSLNNNNS